MTNTITITDPADLRGGDLATLTSTVSPATITAPLSHDPDVQRDVVHVALRIPGINGEHSTSITVRRGDDTGWTVSATREVPDPAPGTTGTATVRGGTNRGGIEATGRRVMRVHPSPVGIAFAWVDAHSNYYTANEVTDFVPDDAAALGAAFALERARLETELVHLRAQVRAVTLDEAADIVESEVARVWKPGNHSAVDQAKDFAAEVLRSEARRDRPKPAAEVPS